MYAKFSKTKKKQEQNQKQNKAVNELQKHRYAYDSFLYFLTKNNKF